MEINNLVENVNRLPDFNMARNSEISSQEKIKLDLPLENLDEKLKSELITLLVEGYINREKIQLYELVGLLEKKIIIQALIQFNGHVKRTAHFLSIKYTTLHEKMKRYHICFRKEPIAS